jgi:hypothetical protein
MRPPFLVGLAPIWGPALSFHGSPRPVVMVPRSNAIRVAAYPEAQGMSVIGTLTTLIGRPVSADDSNTMTVPS